MSRSASSRSLALLLAFLLVSPSLPRARADVPPAPSASSDASEHDTDAREPLDPSRALGMAIANNPSFRATLLDAVAARSQTTAAEDARVPVFTASASGAYNESISSTSQGAVPNRSRQIQGSVGLNYTTPIGTVLSASIGETTVWREVNTTPGTTQLLLIGPTHSGQASLTLRQPLLRGAGTDTVLAEQRQAAANEESAGFDADDAASQLVADVLVAYWELWYAERAMRVQDDAAALSGRQLEEARARQRLGTIAPADVFQFATADATNRETLVTARATRTAKILELARLLGVDTPTMTSLRVGDATPTASAPPPVASVVDALARRSPQLLAIAADIEAAEQRVIASRNAARARLDLTSTVGASVLFMHDAAMVDGVTVNTYPGLAQPRGRPALNASVGVELELPVTSNRARSDLAVARAQLEAAELRYTAAKRALEVEVATRHTELTSAVERMGLVASTATVASELAAAERGRLTLGTTTPADVIAAQQTERTTRLRLDRTTADAAISTLRFEDGAGVLLERFSITTYGETER